MNPNALAKAYDLLDSWGIAETCGRKLSDPVMEMLAQAKGTNPERGDNDCVMWARHTFVCTTFGYAGARDLLLWRHALGKQIDAYPFRRPGESYGSALLRHSMPALWLERPIKEAINARYEMFRDELAYRIEAEQYEDPDPAAHRCIVEDDPALNPETGMSAANLAIYLRNLRVKAA